MEIKSSVMELIGNTPIVRLNRLPDPDGAEVVLKLESYNPGGSVKDRPAANMVLAAEREGRIKPGDTIVEPTSGNTGIGLAMVAAARGYRAIIVLPDTSSRERVALLKGFGAEVIETPGDEGMPGSIRKAEEVVAETPGAFMPQQFENAHNPAAHTLTTAPEILRQTDGKLDVFVSSAGTGGTISGTGKTLKENIPGLKVVVVEPASSPVISGGEPGRNRIPGLGPGFIPKTLDQDVYDEIVQVPDDEAWEVARRLIREEGLLVGPSTGAVVWGCLKVARTLDPGRRVLGVAPDTGERYLSTELVQS